VVFADISFQKSDSGKSCSLINNIEYWLAINVERYQQIRVIEVQIIEAKLESVWGFVIL